MKTVYLLPCQCGQSVEVRSSQAGLTVSCTCGRELAVPTVGGLRQLPQKAAPGGEPRAAWGARQGALLALLLLAAALALGGLYQVWHPPEFPYSGVDRGRTMARAEAFTLVESFQEWYDLSRGLDDAELPSIRQYRESMTRHRRWSWLIFGAALASTASAAVVYYAGGSKR